MAIQEPEDSFSVMSHDDPVIGSAIENEHTAGLEIFLGTVIECIRKEDETGGLFYIPGIIDLGFPGAGKVFPQSITQSEYSVEPVVIAFCRILGFDKRAGKDLHIGNKTVVNQKIRVGNIGFFPQCFSQIRHKNGIFMGIGILDKAEETLLFQVDALSSPRHSPCLAQGGKKHGSKNGDDCYYHRRWGR